MLRIGRMTGWFGAVLLLLLPLSVISQAPPEFKEESCLPESAGKYVSPYSVRFRVPERELIGDILGGNRGNIREQSTLPFYRWDSHFVLRRYGAWGPPARHYPQPTIVLNKPVEWLRQRLLATGLRFVGYDYQHHHIPDWEPPADWPWLKVPSGRNAKGVDCSNFTSFVYNQALGIVPDTDVKKQASEMDVPLNSKIFASHREAIVRASRIAIPATFAEFVKVLKPGDLLFLIRGDGEAYHVAIWVGEFGQSPDGKPLVLDSTGMAGEPDFNGKRIPPGVHLRPVSETSSYFKFAGYALRLIE